VNFKRVKIGPLFWALAVLASVCGLCLWNPDFLDQLECRTYDLRVRVAQRYPAPVVTNLAFVAMKDSSIKAVRYKLLGQSYGLYWPRHIYGRVVEELSAQGAKAIAFDVLFGELRPDHGRVMLANGNTVESDDFFANKIWRSGNVITAFTPETVPADLFATNSLALGDISTEQDSDGVLRRIKSFNLEWHPAFKSAEDQLGVDLDHAVTMPDKIILPIPGVTNLTIKLDRDGNFDMAEIVGDEIPKGFKRFDKPFTRIWDMGIVIAAQELKLDLNKSEIDLPHGRIILHGMGGAVRVLPVDKQGFFYINWQMAAGDPRMVSAPIEEVLREDLSRLHGDTNSLRNEFQGKLVVVGSVATGNDLSDHGATPLENYTFLVSKHWNVANSVITGRFVHRASLLMELALIILLGVTTVCLTWGLRAVVSTLAVLLLITAYVALAFVLFVKFRWWLPLLYPVTGAMFMNHFVLVVHQVVFEQRDKRRVKALFSKVVSPDVVAEILASDIRALQGTRREVTVFFADIRGFTSLTDRSQEQVAEFVHQNNLDLATAEKYFEASAREILETVNQYLAAVADVIKQHGGTLDKYIGDCVMAFWNAPALNEKHALACVQAAVDAQRAINSLNERRQAENAAREAENRERLAAGLPPKPLHVSLQLGTGINTGLVTVGFMGSDQHIVNYTVFGREVNLASRLEGESGSGRIIISDTTYNHLLRHSPALAAICVELFPVKPEGFMNPVRIYEVPWQPSIKDT
jgi:class 3 adenylate cyclase/CHASE2 domain-containing sensor protein